jgi:hypothetical protein
MTQKKTHRPDLSGGNLWDQAFSRDAPNAGARLRFRQYPNPSLEWNDAHDGARFFGRGCASRIRNMKTHSTAEPDEQVALEELAALSLLARWVAEADVEERPPAVTPAPQAPTS